MKVDQGFLDKLKENGIPDGHVQSVKHLINKLNGLYKVVLRNYLSKSSYVFLHKFADDNVIIRIDSEGKLWVYKPALDKFCSEEKIAKLYKSLKQLTGWAWADHTSTTNPQAEVSRWHDKVDEMAIALINVFPHKDDDDLDEGEEM